MPFKRKKINRTEVDGVPCFFGNAPPPYMATLVFRVGRADESLRTGGLTHMAEHLVMPAEPPSDYDRNARVEDIYTAFWANGRREEVTQFLTDTCALIKTPPLERLETERSILQTEGAGRNNGPLQGALALRYGAAGPGLAGWDEYGLHWVGPSEVNEWIGERFTTGNAACWMTFPPSSGFRLPLHSGTLIGPPEPARLTDIETPAHFPFGPPGQTVLAVEAQRSTALVASFNIFRDRAWRVLRYETGLAYEIGDWYEPLTAEKAHAGLWVDTLDRNVAAASERLLSLLDDLCVNGPTDDELREEIERGRQSLTDPSLLQAKLHFAAYEHLLEREYSIEELIREKEALTSEAVAEALAAARETMLLVLPEDVSAPSSVRPYPINAPRRVDGRRFPAKGFSLRGGRPVLIVGDEGVSVTSPTGDLSTVLFTECEVALHSPDNVRTLVGRDGFRIYFQPDEWRRGNEALAAIDAKTPHGVIVVANE